MIEVSKKQNWTSMTFKGTCITNTENHAKNNAMPSAWRFWHIVVICMSFGAVMNIWSIKYSTGIHHAT